MEISPRFSSDDFKSLTFAAEEDWQRPVEIFQDRFEGRFFAVVDQIDSYPFAGFAVLALDCLLIETLQQFREAVRQTPSGQGCAYFESFLTGSDFDAHFSKAAAKVFYDQFRCGILHQGEIKKSSKVWRIGPLVQPTQDRKGLIVNRKKFHKALRAAFDEFVANLRAGRDQKLRQNFRIKMGYICQ